MTYVLDTNIITAILKGNDKAKQKMQEAIIQGADVFISAISYYEIKRGLLAVNATRQLEKFNLLCKIFGLLLLGTQSIFDEAAMIYASLKQKGKLISDADILIASVVKTHKFVLVSNDSDFREIRELSVEDWLA